MKLYIVSGITDTTQYANLFNLYSLYTLNLSPISFMKVARIFETLRNELHFDEKGKSSLAEEHQVKVLKSALNCLSQFKAESDEKAWICSVSIPFNTIIDKCTPRDEFAKIMDMKFQVALLKLACEELSGPKKSAVYTGLSALDNALQ